MPAPWQAGSYWHRWDVHVHTPETALNDQYKCTWDEFIEALSKVDPTIRAIGITDYLRIDSYKRVRQAWLDKRLSNIEFLFPNIELRISPHTKEAKGINVHLLVDPSDEAHIDKIETALTRLTFDYKGQSYSCTTPELVRLGKAFQPSQTDDRAALSIGINQFKIDLTAFRDFLNGEAWLRNNALIAVAASSHDGAAGLKDDSGYAATREEVYRLANVIFSGNPNDRDYWLGLKKDPPADLVRRFGALKPCLHGSDTHSLDKLCKPDADRYCWIKADTTFVGLRQTLFEPADRVWIGAKPPPQPGPESTIGSLIFDPSPTWLSPARMDFNSGLVAIVGPRGSGKTALAEAIAAATGAATGGRASFLEKARDLLGNTSVHVIWQDGTQSGQTSLADASEQIQPSVRYLSQQFVESLCADDGPSDRLIGEVESVVFDHLGETERLSAANFSELREIETAPMQTAREEFVAQIQQAGDAIVREREAHDSISQKQQRINQLKVEVAGLQTTLKGLTSQAPPEVTAKYTTLRAALNTAAEAAAAVKERREKLELLGQKLSNFEARGSAFYADAQALLAEIGAARSEIDAFKPQFPADVRAVLRSLDQAAKIKLDELVGVEPSASTFPKSVRFLEQEMKAVEVKLAESTQRQKQAADAQRSHAQKDTEKKKLEAEVNRIAAGYDDRLRALHDSRMKAYLDIFTEIERERVVLGRLYEPLHDHLKSQGQAERQLRFYVETRVDADSWIARGERLFDGRKHPFFKYGGLTDATHQFLVKGWRQADRASIETGMRGMLDATRDAMKHLTAGTTPRAVAQWLFSTEHIRLRYGLRYGETDLQKLSPGAKGIVLLSLYLAVDRNDFRPLIIDQPEENLDPKSVYEILVENFRRAKQRRQVIIVTHNPNLVVNTDADQVIIASATPNPGKLPTISYVSGALEDPDIRKQVCEILEGGEQAFLDRERKYDLRRRRPDYP